MADNQADNHIASLARAMHEYVQVVFQKGTELFVVNENLEGVIFSDIQNTNTQFASRTQAVNIAFDDTQEGEQRIRVYTERHILHDFRILLLDWPANPRGRAILGYLMYSRVRGTLQVSDYRMSLARGRIPEILRTGVVLMVGIRIRQLGNPIELVSIFVRQEVVSRPDLNVELRDVMQIIKDDFVTTRILANANILMRTHPRYDRPPPVERSGHTIPPLMSIPGLEVDPRIQAASNEWLQNVWASDGLVITPTIYAPLPPVLPGAIERRLRFRDRVAERLAQEGSGQNASVRNEGDENKQGKNVSGIDVPAQASSTPTRETGTIPKTRKQKYPFGVVVKEDPPRLDGGYLYRDVYGGYCYRFANRDLVESAEAEYNLKHGVLPTVIESRFEEPITAVPADIVVPERIVATDEQVAQEMVATDRRVISQETHDSDVDVELARVVSSSINISSDGERCRICDALLSETADGHFDRRHVCGGRHV